MRKDVEHMNPIVLSFEEEEAWTDAVASLVREKKPRELVKLLVKFSTVPQFVRNLLSEWLEGKLQPINLSYDDWKLMQALHRYKNERIKSPKISQDKLADHISKKRGVPKDEIINYLKGKSAAYKRIHKAERAAGGRPPFAKDQIPTITSVGYKAVRKTGGPAPAAKGRTPKT